MDLDFYGFPLRLSAQQAGARARCDATEKKASKTWFKIAKKGQVPSGDDRKKLCRKGIPPEYRSDQWWVISGAAARAAQKGPNYFRTMVELGRSSSTDRQQIQTDLPRTFPTNVWLATREAQLALERVLLAYSMHNPQVGYCQGLNYLGGMLLLVMQRDEERAFWVLVSLLDEGILYKDMYSHNLVGAHVEMQSLAELVIEKMPKLAEHFSQAQCDITIVATDWFLCLFCTTLPSETAMRVWDALLCEGPKILYRVSLALLKTNEAALMQVGDAGSMLRHLRVANASIHDRDALMTLAFDHVGSMPMSKIQEHRAEKQAVMSADLRQRSSKKNLQRAIQRGSSVTGPSGDELQMAVASQPPPSEQPQQQRSPLMASLDTMHRIKRAYSGSKESSAAAMPQRKGSSGREAAPPLRGSAATNGSSGYRTPQQQMRPAARQPGEEEFILTVKDVTSSSEGSFAGHIVAGDKLVMSPEYQ